MTTTEARRFVGPQYGIDPVRLGALLDQVRPSTLAQWTYIVSQLGHTSAAELRSACLASSAYDGAQS